MMPRNINKLVIAEKTLQVKIFVSFHLLHTWGWELWYFQGLNKLDEVNWDVRTRMLWHLRRCGLRQVQCGSPLAAADLKCCCARLACPPQVFCVASREMGGGSGSYEWACSSLGYTCLWAAAGCKDATPAAQVGGTFMHAPIVSGCMLLAHSFLAWCHVLCEAVIL